MQLNIVKSNIEKHQLNEKLGTSYT